MGIFSVSEQKKQWLGERMKALKIDERDLEEKFIKSSGKGGQNVNKKSTCVFLKHLPTGITVKCGRDRSQSVNRFLARRELVRKMERLVGIQNVEQMEVSRIRKQKLKRKKRAVRKMMLGRSLEKASPEEKFVQ